MFRLVNSRYFIKIVHVKRIVVNACAMLGGYILIAVACLLPQDYIVGFFISLVAAVVHGLTACFGESTILGYLKGFPAELIVGWSSGTGFAGVVGAGLVVLLLYFQFELFTVFFFHGFIGNYRSISWRSRWWRATSSASFISTDRRRNLPARRTP